MKMRRLYEKYRALPIPVKASFWYAFCLVAQKGISVLTVPIFTRMLSTSDYGIVSVFNSWEGILINFTSLSLSSGVFNNGMLKYPEDRDGFTSSMVGLTSLMTLAWFACFVLFHGQVEAVTGLSFGLMALMFVHLFFSPAFSLWAARKRYSYDYKPFVIVTLLCSLAEPAVSIAAVHFSDGNPATARLASAVAVSSAIYGCVYLDCLKRGKKLFCREYWRYGLLFNIPLIPHYLSGTVLNSTDRILIERFCGAGDAGVYSVAYSAAMLLTLFTSAINSALTPWLYRKMADRDTERIRKVSSALVLLMAGLTLLWILMAPEILRILAPAEYAGAAYIIPPVAAGAFFWYLYTLFANVQFYFEKTRFIAMSSVGAAVMNIVLNLMFIPKYGYLAAGYTTLASYMAYAGAHVALSRKIARENRLGGMFDLRVVSLAGAALLALMFVALPLYGHAALRYALMGCMFAAAAMGRRKIAGALGELLKRGKGRGE